MTYSCGFTGEDRNDIYLKVKEKEHGLYNLACHGSWSQICFRQVLCLGSCYITRFEILEY